MDKYDDIINLPHWEPKTHKRMSMQTRAAQFAPFAALVGHQEAIDETARLTDTELDREHSDVSVINSRMARLIEFLSDGKSIPPVDIMYFEPDKSKSGGAYVRYSGIPRKYDEYAASLVFTDGTIIKIPAIVDLSGPLFADD